MKHNKNMTKEEFVKSLSNVKIVFGNGADLYCGLKTKYSDYFETKKTYYSNIIRLFNEFKAQYDIENNPKELFRLLQCGFGYNPSLVKNIWDVLFCLSFANNNNNVLWCDVELKIHNSFIKKSAIEKGCVDFSIIHWDIVNELVHDYNRSTHASPEELFVAMISNIICEEKNDKGYYNFYSFLKYELIRFEYLFGLYIEEVTAHTSDLEKKQKDLLNVLSNINQVVSIDTFNYSDFYGAPDSALPRHINGTFVSPIFGIDRSLDEYENNFLSNEAFNYFKTSRRMDQELIQNNITKQENFDNVIVFGHSLNKQDYSYFYPILDRIKASDSTSNSCFVVAYHIYDETKADSIRLNIKNSIVNLFSTYEKEHLGLRDARLLDFLTTQNRIILYQI